MRASDLRVDDCPFANHVEISGDHILQRRKRRGAALEALRLLHCHEAISSDRFVFAVASVQPRGKLDTRTIIACSGLASAWIAIQVPRQLVGPAALLIL